MSKRRFSVGIIGARGHVGGELIRLIDAHPDFSLAFVSSRELAGRPVKEHVATFFGDLAFDKRCECIAINGTILERCDERWD